MKTFKSLLVLLLLTVGIAGRAQTTQKEALKALMQTSPIAMNMKLQNGLELLNAKIIKDYDEAKSKELVDKYIKGPYLDDLAEAMLPFFEDKLNVKEMNELTTILQTERGKAYLEHSMKINNIINLEPLRKEIANKVVRGEELTPIQPIDCPNSYKKLFQQYYEKSGQEEIVKSMFDSLDDSMTDELKPIIGKCYNYLLNNIPTIMLNDSYGILTEDDMRFAIELSKNQAWPKYQKAISDLVSSIQELYLSILMNYTVWLQDQGVETTL